MCFYITGTLPQTTKIDSLKNLFKNFNMAFNQINNKNIISQIRPGEKYFRITREYCDCNTILGVSNKQKEYQTLLNSKKVKTLRKRKWTDDQISSWIYEKIKDKEMPLERRLTPIEKEEKIKKWIEFLRKILDNKLVSRIGLLKHWYNQGLEEEEFKIRETRKVNIDDINPKILLNMEEDVLYEFFPSYNIK